eukprot:55670_1
MGCTVSKRTMLEAYRADNMPQAKALAANPLHLANDITFIPVNYITGEYTPKYPKWLKHSLSTSQYSTIIFNLNKLSQTSLIWNNKRLLQYAKIPRSKAHILMQKDKTIFNDQLDILLLELNNTILNPLGLTASSTLRKLHVKPSEMGVLIKHVHIPRPSPNAGECIILSSYEADNIGKDKMCDHDMRSCSHLPSL